jgi:hypothetical protein
VKIAKFGHKRLNSTINFKVIQGAMIMILLLVQEGYGIFWERGVLVKL